MGDLATTWATAFQQMGVQTFVSVNGSTLSSLSVRIDGQARRQSLPPGDVVILVLPPGEQPRRPGVYLLEFVKDKTSP